MAENLSFLGVKSSAYIWETQRIKVYADENFAREKMQLFTMGLVQLNMDGTPKLDNEGNKCFPIPIMTSCHSVELVLALNYNQIKEILRVQTGLTQ